MRRECFVKQCGAEVFKFAMQWNIDTIVENLDMRWFSPNQKIIKGYIRMNKTMKIFSVIIQIALKQGSNKNFPKVKTSIKNNLDFFQTSNST